MYHTLWQWGGFHGGTEYLSTSILQSDEPEIYSFLSLLDILSLFFSNDYICNLQVQGIANVTANNLSLPITPCHVSYNMTMGQVARWEGPLDYMDIAAQWACNIPIMIHSQYLIIIVLKRIYKKCYFLDTKDTQVKVCGHWFINVVSNWFLIKCLCYLGQFVHECLIWAIIVA